MEGPLTGDEGCQRGRSVTRRGRPFSKPSASTAASIGDMQLDEVQPGDLLAIIKARTDTTASGCSSSHDRWPPALE